VRDGNSAPGKDFRKHGVQWERAKTLWWSYFGAAKKKKEQAEFGKKKLEHSK